MHTGAIVQTEDDFFRHVVKRAARIAALAASDEIRVSDETYRIVQDASDLQFSDPHSIALKGFDEEQVVHRLIWRAEP